MKSYNIKLSTIEDVRNFVNSVSKYDADADLKSGRYTVDAKSLMGIFSLDLLKPIELVIYNENSDELFSEIKKFIVE